jgi:carbon-monoxide dehydrogenase large subunit
VEDLATDGISAAGHFASSERTYSYGTHAAHVTVDTETGVVDVLNYVAVEDVGRIVNPNTLHGQARGAIIQGLGGTLLEQLAYDSDGQLVSGSLMDYALPNAAAFPHVEVVATEKWPSPHNPLGVKGAGEGGIIPVAGVIGNAIASALSSFQIEPCDLPLSLERTWKLIRDKRRSDGAIRHRAMQHDQSAE